MTELKELYSVGEQPPLGYVPPKMYAWMVRPERFGEPMKAWQVEVIDVPDPADDEVLLCLERLVDCPIPRASRPA